MSQAVEQKPAIQGQEIDRAIGAHGMWKARLAAVVEGGRLETPIETIRVDNACEFGKWLHGPSLSRQEKASTQYAAVERLHAEFHKMAARVVTLATTGNRAEAERLMALNGEYAQVSAKLTSAMMDWKKSRR